MTKINPGTNEELVLASRAKKIEAYSQRYDEVFDTLAKSSAFTGARSFNNNDVLYLGECFEQFRAYEEYCNENASASDLGTLPAVAVDLLAASYAISVAPLLASMQTMGEQRGIIYFKKVNYVDSRGDITAGDEFVTATEGIKKNPDKYMAEFVEDELFSTTVATTLQYTGTLVSHPIRSNIPVLVTIPEKNFEGQFVNGVLLSSGWGNGTLNLQTGAMTINFVADPGGAHEIYVSYHQDFEKSEDIPEIEMTLTDTDILAEVLALKMKISTLKAFQLNKRFGKVAENDALMDLAGAMADAESRKVILKGIALAELAEAIPGNTPLTWPKTAPSGISEYEHRQSFKYALSLADSSLNRQAGRGWATRYVAGYLACEYFAALPKFTRAANNIAVGPHVFGYLDGVPVIRAKYVDTNTILAWYVNPQSPFEAPVAVGTYMPVFITNTLQVGENPLQNQRAIASWKGFKGVVKQFVRKITLTA